MIREYELGLVINPDLNDEQLEAQLLRIGQVVESNGGEVTKLDRWGRRRLSYSIDRHREGYYAFMDLRLESLAVREVEGVLRVQEGIMRHLITWRDPRAQAERRRREIEEAARAAAQAARVEAEDRARAAQAAHAEAQAQAQAAHAAHLEAQAASAPPPVAQVAPVAEPEAVAPVATATDTTPDTSPADATDTAPAAAPDTTPDDSTDQK